MTINNSPKKLNASAIRERAKSIPGCQEVLAQEGESVLSFIVQGRNGNISTTISSLSSSSATNTSSSIARVNIFVSTGTVGTSRVLNGVVRQRFRRNVDSLDVIERILKHPEGPMEIDEGLIGFTDDDVDKKLKNNLSRTITNDLELAHVGICILRGEQDKLQQHLQSIDNLSATDAVLETLPKKRDSQSEANSRSHKNADDTGFSDLGSQNLLQTLQNQQTKQMLGRPEIAAGAGTAMPSQQRSQRRSVNKEDDDYDDDASSSSKSTSSSAASSSIHGTEFHFKLPTDVMKQVDQCLRDISKMDKVVKGVSTNGKGTVFLYGNGGVAYTPSIPKALYHKLRQLRSSSYASRPCYCSLGSRDRYFVAFNDGTADWKGPSALDKILKKALAINNNTVINKNNNDVSASRLPRSVAFGSTYDTFFIVFHDGSWQYQGRGIPETLEEKLSSRGDRDDLVNVNLGANGEWFLKAENGRMWWSGISQEMDGVLATILKEAYLHNMDFGENGSYFVTYDRE